MDSTTLPSLQRWAVLIGINWYSDTNTEINLEGCVNDVEIMKDKLITNLNVPRDHITVLTAVTGPQVDDPSRPTKTNVIKAIRNTAKGAKPGDFLYIHYSGHGDRRDTKYPDLKSGTTMDEVLCTLEEHITDVEFGNLLDELAEKLVVCAVLDCCFSGGSTRHDEKELEERRVRCRNPKSVFGSATSRGIRNTVPKKSWFYRSRAYNAIAAAQPHEKAREHLGDNGKIYGRMTYHLVQSLNTLQTSTEPVTYGRLQDVLEAKCRATWKRTGKRQQPMHLGDRTRAVFSDTNPDLSQRSVIASIIAMNGKTVILNKGSASGINLDDKFRIYHPSQLVFGTLVTNASHSAEVVVRKVEGLQSRAVICDVSHVSPVSLQGTDIGWFAELSEPAKPVQVSIHMPQEGLPVAIQRLQHDWHSHVDRRLQLDLQFGSPAENVDIVVEVDGESVFRFRDGKGNQMSHVPLLRADCPRHGGELAKLLKHISSYQLVANLAHPTSSVLPPYKFEIKRVAKPEEDRDSFSAWQVRFKNEHSCVLYLTILNLSPAYGIHQIFPSHTQFASSAAVEPGAEIPKLEIDIVVPELLRQAAARPKFRMEDTIKAFVTTQQVNFCDYLLPDLTDLGNSEQDVPVKFEDDDSDSCEDDNSDSFRDDDSVTLGEDDPRDLGLENEATRTAKVRETQTIASWFVAEELILTET